MYRNILVLFFVLVSFFLFSNSAKASSVILNDNFEISAVNWTPSAGNWVIRDGKYGAVANNPSENAASMSNVDLTTPNYTIELDMYPIQGIDRTIRFRFGSNINVYDIHFTNDGIATNFGLDTHSFVLVNHPFNENYGYHIKVVLEDQHFQFFIDGNLLFDKTDPDYIFDGHEQFGLIVATGSVPTEVYFDNILITTDEGLDVPLLKQTDPLWADDIYDSAGLWTTESPTIGRWGCAITSAAMVLQYHNVTKLPNGDSLNPGTLNAYLKSIPNGYKKNGNTNWEAIAAMTKEAKNLNPEFKFSALKYKRGSNDLNDFNEDINDNIPNILQVALPFGDHFVVAKGVDGQNVSINDPGFDRTDLTEYSNAFASTRRFIPSNTDLSYMVFDVDPNINVVLKDQNGNAVGNSYLDQPIVDRLELLTNTSGSLKVLEYSEPPSGNYMLEIGSPVSATYDIKAYLYSKDGGVKVMNLDGYINGNTSDFYEIDFDKDNIGESTVNQATTFTSLINDISSLYQLGNISNKGTYNFLTNKIEQAQKYEITNPEKSKSILESIRQLLIDDKKNGIDIVATQYLISQIELLVPPL